MPTLENQPLLRSAEIKMRVLCLHGWGTNAAVLQTQLAPVIYDLAKTEEIQFHFVNGPVEAEAAMGIAEEYEGPYYRFFDKEAPHIDQALSLAQRLARQVKVPEDWGREWRNSGMADVGSSKPCDFVQQHVEQHEKDQFDGVLGFSEGASVAASLILRQLDEKGTSPFKFAIFICSVAPFRWDCKDIMLADETTQRISMPTAHIVGSKDPLYQGSKVLYNFCHQPSASIFDHQGTHTIPWDLVSTQGITKAIRATIQKSQSALPA